MRIIKNYLHLINALLATIYYRYPARRLKVIGVTGTDGKTTTVHLIYEILKRTRKKVSMVSTIYAEIAGRKYDTGFHVTTPSPWALQKIVRRIVDRGEEYLVLEVTSHGLDQNRIFVIPFEVAVITNVTHEHLDYHHNFHAYLKTKAKILKGTKYCVLNRDDKSFRILKSFCQKKVATFGLKRGADCSPFNAEFKTKLPGEYNIYNCLAAYQVARYFSIEKKDILKVLASFSSVTGRMEQVRTRKGFFIYIDFAHTPNALAKVLIEARKRTKNRLISVFGCAGERDKLKRPMMGEIAAKLADIIVLTAEDPRREDVRDIIEQITQGSIKAGARYLDKKKNIISLPKSNGPYLFKIADRQEAINFAIRKLAKKGDVVIITGKGHEKSLCYGKVEYPWDEKKAIEKALYGTVKTP